MNEPKPRSHEINTEKDNFQAEIDTILNRGVTPENVDTYADDALENLVDIIGEIVKSQQYTFPFTELENERHALAAVGLDPNSVEQTLDHIADVAEEIHALDGFIGNHFNNGSIVVTPPAITESRIIVGDGHFEEKQLIPRLKTTLLLLSREFGINIEDASQLHIVPGTVTPEMMRRTPYNLIDLPSLNRMINVCDEEGNKTFIFDRKKMLEAGFDTDAIVRMEKGELDHLLTTDNTLGRSIIYSRYFARNLTDAIQDIEDRLPQSTNLSEVTLLQGVKKASVDYSSPSGLASELGVDKNLVFKAMHELGPNLGEVEEMMFYAKVAPALSPEQKQSIKDWLNENHYLRESGGNYMARKALAKHLGVSERSLEVVIEELSDALGEIKKRKMVDLIDVYSPLQQDMLKNYLIEQKFHKPEGYLPVYKVAAALTVNPNTIERAIERIGDALGEIELFRSGRRTYTLLSPRQQEIIKKWMAENIRRSKTQIALTALKP
jgi:DNA-binding transcriptional regulator YhcF (GntR family)